MESEDGMVSTDNSFKAFVTGGEQERVRAGPRESREIKVHSFLNLPGDLSS